MKLNIVCLFKKKKNETVIFLFAFMYIFYIYEMALMLSTFHCIFIIKSSKQRNYMFVFNFGK